MNQHLSDADVLHVCSTVRGHYGLPPWREILEGRDADLIGPARP